MKQTFRCLDSKGRAAATVEAFGAKNAARAIFRDKPVVISGWDEAYILKRLQVLNNSVWTWASDGYRQPVQQTPIGD